MTHRKSRRMVDAWVRLKTRLRATSFARQLTFALTSAILLLAILVSMIDSWDASRRLESHFVEQGKYLAENFASQSTLALLYVSAENGEAAVASTLTFPDVLQAEIVDRHQVVILRKKKSEHSKLKSELTQAIDRSVMLRETPSEWYFAAPVFAGDNRESPFEPEQSRKHELLGYAKVVIGKHTLHKLVLSLWIGNLIVTLLIASLLIGALNLLTKHLLRPLRVLSEAMLGAKSGKTGIRADLTGPRDIAEMAQTFNEMIVVIEDREAELKRTRDAALQTALLNTQFTAMASHEIRTPLNGVVGMLDMVRGTPLDERQAEYIEVAWKSARALRSIINNILDLSKLESGKLELDEREFDLRLMVEDVIEMLTGQAHSKQLELGYVFGAGVPEIVYGDALRIKQVLLNLIGNALKFTAHGEVALKVSGQPIDVTSFQLSMEVVDTGIGIDPSRQDSIFDAYSQADRSTSSTYGGSGLGLAICKKLVEMMGGDIGVLSEPGKGSTFFFSVLCRIVPSAPPMLDNSRLHGLRVLICTESTIVRNFIDCSLSKYGVQCGTVLSLSAGITELQRSYLTGSHYHIVVVDGDHNNLIRRIRLEAGLRPPRILALDTFGAASSDFDARHKADLYLRKPLRLSALVEGIHRLLAYELSSPIAALSQTEVCMSGEPRRFRALVVDDNASNRMVTARMLERIGLECILACNGIQAVQAALNDRFDLVLMDCSMPEMDGFEATAHIRRQEETIGRRTPIVALTANTYAGVRDKCHAAGMDDYLVKPVTVEDLQDKVMRWTPFTVSMRNER